MDPAVRLAGLGELADGPCHGLRRADRVTERDRGAALDLVGDRGLAVGGDEVRVVGQVAIQERLPPP